MRCHRGYHSSLRVNAGHVYRGLELHTWWTLWVLLTTEQLQLEDLPFVCSLIFSHINKQTSSQSSQTQNNLFIYFYPPLKSGKENVAKNHLE